jgi:hypothetical protein
MTLWYALKRRWQEAQRDKLARYLQRYRKRRARLDAKQLRAQARYEALRAELDK